MPGTRIERLSPLLSYLLPRLEDVLFGALFVGVVGLGPRLLNLDGDLGRHITIGGTILDSGHIPTADIFSHTLTGQPLTPHEWLAQVLFAFAHRLGGLDGVVLLCAALIAATFTLLFRQCLERSQSLLTALAVTILAAAAASLHWLARPHLFSLFFVVVWTGVLERLRRGENAAWWLPALLMLLWANTHGAFVAGFVIWGIYLAGSLLETLRWSWPGLPWKGRAQGESSGHPPLANGRLLFAGLLALPASLANPAGWRLWETSFGFLRNRYLVGHTAEYLPPDFHTPGAWPFLFMIVLSIFLLGVQRGRQGATPVLSLAAWTAMGLYSARNVPLYAVIAAPTLAASLADATGFIRALDGRLRRIDRQLRGHLWPAATAALVALALFSGATLDFSGRGNRFDEAVFPVRAVDWLEERELEGEVFNHFPWGGYLLYRSWPQRQVFIDGQTDFYGEALTRQYEQVITLSAGWRQVLRDYGVDWAIVPADSALAAALRSEPGWKEIYRDGTASILVSNP